MSTFKRGKAPTDPMAAARRESSVSGYGSVAGVDMALLKQMVRDIALTQAEEMGCDTCFSHVDAYVELVLTGRKASEAMPLVAHHLSLCKECQDEFRALLSAVREMD